MKYKKKLKEKLKIAEFLALFLLGDLDETLHKKIADWLSEDDTNYQLLGELCNPEYGEKREVFIENIDKEKNWKIFSKRLEKSPSIIPYFKYAAVLFPFFVLGYWLFFFSQSDSDQFFASNIEIHPGVKQAQLRLHSGELIALSEKDILMVNQDSTIQIENKDKTLNYKLADTQKIVKKKRKNIVSHELIVAKGQEYHLVLSDGTEVWLNSDSRLKFPITFPNGQRVVELIGEAYFDVTKNKSAPFIVKTAAMNIKVLGTAFNISAYPREEEQQTTLVTGKIAAMLNDSESTLLELLPNQQIIYNVESNKYAVKYVDAESYGDWRGGVFVFEEATLETITNKLARWYDIHFFFQNQKAKEQKFTGKLPRFENCEVLLKIIEKSTNVKFTIDGEKKSITVSTR